MGFLRISWFKNGKERNFVVVFVVLFGLVCMWFGVVCDKYYKFIFNVGVGEVYEWVGGNV